MPSSHELAQPSTADQGGSITEEAVLLSLSHVVKHFPLRKGKQVVHAVNDVSLEIRRGETLALVGESGSGKTTIGRLILGLEQLTSGEIYFQGMATSHLAADTFRRSIRPHVQMVFQEPFESLDPRMRVRDAIAEPLKQWRTVRGSRVSNRVHELTLSVGLKDDLLTAYPHQLTSGQQQRVAIARAIAIDPDLVVLDEPTSYLDPKERARLLDLLLQLQRDRGLAYLFISHDLSKVRALSHQIAVMYLGQVVEVGPTAAVFSTPEHPYTRALLSSVLIPDPCQRESLILLRGEIPSPVALPSGCFFHTRCPYAIKGCVTQRQQLVATGPGRQVACWRVTDRHESLDDTPVAEEQRLRI